MELLTTREVGNRVKKCRETVLNYVRDGKLDGVKVGSRWLISEASLRRLLGEKQGLDDAGVEELVDERSNRADQSRKAASV